VRLLRILCVLMVIGFAALALGMALSDPANRSHAQNQIEIQANPAAGTRSASASTSRRTGVVQRRARNPGGIECRHSDLGRSIAGF
jgi:hypothetical protein